MHIVQSGIKETVRLDENLERVLLKNSRNSLHKENLRFEKPPGRKQKTHIKRALVSIKSFFNNY